MSNSKITTEIWYDLFFMLNVGSAAEVTSIRHFREFRPNFFSMNPEIKLGLKTLMWRKLASVGHIRLESTFLNYNNVKNQTKTPCVQNLVKCSKIPVALKCLIDSVPLDRK